MNFTDALNVNVAEIERPPLPPIGTYTWKVEKVEFGEVGTANKFDTVDIRLQAIESGEDVSPSKLSDFGGLKMVKQRLRFMFPKAEGEEQKAQFERTMFNLRRFLEEHLKLDPNGTLKQKLTECIGQVCLGDIKYRPDQNDPEVMYAEIGRTAPLG